MKKQPKPKKRKGRWQVNTAQLTAMVTDPESYEWREAFGYAGEPNTNGSPNLEAAAPGMLVGLEPFTRRDIAAVYGAVQGDNGGLPWIAWGVLNDGRWFALKAGCDYTGWDCQASGECIMADTRENLERFGMDDEFRARLKQCPPPSCSPGPFKPEPVPSDEEIDSAIDGVRRHQINPEDAFIETYHALRKLAKRIGVKL